MSMYPLAELYGGANESDTSRHPHILPGVSFARWKRDERAPRCDVCTRKFSLLRRRHHCRACGEICCRNCVDFRLVDVPGIGPDIAYACRRCIERHDRKPSLVEDLATLARSFDQRHQTRVNVRPGRSNTTFSNSHGPAAARRPAARSGSASVASSPTHCFMPPSPHGVTTLSPMASAVTPVVSPRRWTTDFKVIISQARHARLQITCLMIRDYLECKGGAIVLLEDSHVWVVAHKGLRASTLHSDTFLSICHQAVKSKESFTASRPLDRSKSIESNVSAATSRDHCRFFGAAPIFHHDKQFSTIGCLVALDTKPRDDIAARRTLASLERLARVVGDALLAEQNLLRIFTSGDFKIFAADGLSTASLSSAPGTAAPSCIGTLSPRYGTVQSPPAHDSGDLRRSRSFIFGNETSFFERYAEDAETNAKPPLKAVSTSSHLLNALLSLFRKLKFSLLLFSGFLLLTLETCLSLCLLLHLKELFLLLLI
ncbi:hypothetical protein P43SY_003761 [Pythium insidiosum]|uniref:FYVE-type domain-containing protein n=1 Tax=Pythium insidiosum TaxID=114742 RepID=A0AAD5Q3D0_PYTIN|nr:hypothetical protein P43SY_003761 [Pythium insidiosum]